MSQDPIPGRTRDRSESKPNGADLNANRQKIEDVIQDVMKGVKAPTKTKDEEIVERVNIIVADTQREFLTMYKINVVPMQKETALQNIRTLYKQKFSPFTHDELLDVLTLTLSSLAVESLHDKLI